MNNPQSDDERLVRRVQDHVTSAESVLLPKADVIAMCDRITSLGAELEQAQEEANARASRISRDALQRASIAERSWQAAEADNKRLRETLWDLDARLCEKNPHLWSRVFLDNWLSGIAKTIKTALTQPAAGGEEP